MRDRAGHGGFGFTSLTNYGLDPRFMRAELRSRAGLGEALDEDLLQPSQGGRARRMGSDLDDYEDRT